MEAKLNYADMLLLVGRQEEEKFVAHMRINELEKYLELARKANQELIHEKYVLREQYNSLLNSMRKEDDSPRQGEAAGHSSTNSGEDREDIGCDVSSRPSNESNQCISERHRTTETLRSGEDIARTKSNKFGRC